MICAGIFMVVYLAMGAVVSFESYRRGWNERLSHYDKTSNLGWFLFWWWFGHMIFFQNLSIWYTRFNSWFDDTTDSMFERMSERWNDEADS